MAQQLDYIFFVYGLSFLLLAMAAGGCAVRRHSNFPWKWLAGFGLLHGVNEWLDMLVFGLGDSTWFGSLRLAAMTASFLLLIGRQLKLI